MTEEEYYALWKRKTLLLEIKNQRKIDESCVENTLCDYHLCQLCGGDCCQSYPCAFSPFDFLDLRNLNYMRPILNTGIVCIRPVRSNNFILRVRGYEEKNTIIAKNRHKINPCILASDKGCLLPTLYRPSEGLLFVPYLKNQKIKHSILYSMNTCIQEYAFYKKVLNQLYSEYKSKKIPIPQNKEEKVEKLMKALVKQP